MFARPDSDIQGYKEIDWTLFEKTTRTGFVQPAQLAAGLGKNAKKVEIPSIQAKRLGSEQGNFDFFRLLQFQNRQLLRLVLSKRGGQKQISMDSFSLTQDAILLFKLQAIISYKYFLKKNIGILSKIGGRGTQPQVEECEL